MEMHVMHCGVYLSAREDFGQAETEAHQNSELDKLISLG